MNKFRWAYIGCGSIAEKTAKDITKGNHQIVSVYSRNYEKACAFAEKFGAAAFKSAEEAILCDTVDGVYIATPHTSHLEYSITALEHHKPVLCEKPVGINVADVDKLINCARKNETYFCEAMWTWFSDVALTVKEWMQSDKIGEVKEVKINYSFPGVLKPKTSRVLLPETAGGALLDIG
ncbi:MAG: Gfo/Idh/MocA family oxidoreductase, partial [Eubacterium sp.]|nr:Gfo/Idh/MocA family oxidoreductase [Eubacterium sp.]